jgi:hypothetical protein
VAYRYFARAQTTVDVPGGLLVRGVDVAAERSDVENVSTLAHEPANFVFEMIELTLGA